MIVAGLAVMSIAFFVVIDAKLSNDPSDNNIKKIVQLMIAYFRKHN